MCHRKAGVVRNRLAGAGRDRRGRYGLVWRAGARCEGHGMAGGEWSGVWGEVCFGALWQAWQVSVGSGTVRSGKEGQAWWVAVCPDKVRWIVVRQAGLG